MSKKKLDYIDSKILCWLHETLEELRAAKAAHEHVVRLRTIYSTLVEKHGYDISHDLWVFDPKVIEEKLDTGNTYVAQIIANECDENIQTFLKMKWGDDIFINSLALDHASRTT